MDYETTRTAANCFSQLTKGDVFTQLLSEEEKAAKSKIRLQIMYIVHDVVQKFFLAILIVTLLNNASAKQKR